MFLRDKICPTISSQISIDHVLVKKCPLHTFTKSPREASTYIHTYTGLQRARGRRRARVIQWFEPSLASHNIQLYCSWEPTRASRGYVHIHTYRYITLAVPRITAPGGYVHAEPWWPTGAQREAPRLAFSRSYLYIKLVPKSPLRSRGLMSRGPSASAPWARTSFASATPT